MPAYDDNLFSPPAPVARVTLRNLETGESIRDIPMLLDSGADATVIPAVAVLALSIRTTEDAGFQVEAFGGARSAAPLARLEMVLEGRTFKGEFLIVDQEWGVIGRNVLNHLPILLDGPRLHWEFVKRS